MLSSGAVLSLSGSFASVSIVDSSFQRYIAYHPWSSWSVVDILMFALASGTVALEQRTNVLHAPSWRVDQNFMFCLSVRRPSVGVTFCGLSYTTIIASN